MRIVEFPYSGTGEPNWPAEGESAFSNAKSLGDKIVGEYSGADETLTDYAGNKYMGRQYRTHITEGELIELMGEGPYTKAFRGAFPQGAAPADDVSLFFFERTRRPARNDALSMCSVLSLRRPSSTLLTKVICLMLIKYEYNRG